MENPPPPPLDPRQHGRRRPYVIGFAMASAIALLSAVGSVTPAAALTGPQTIVSFTFDDANADQLPAATALAAHDMDGTFYINSGSVGQSGYLSTSDLTALQSAGNEIGGHTVNHPDLATLPTTEAKQQICLDRDNLIDMGLTVRSFAYPFASVTPALEQLVADCGYNSARGLGDVKSRFGCPDCDYAETTPPDDAYLTKALDEVDSTWTLDDFKNSVTNAEAGGGWVQLTFHHYCDNTCDELSVNSTIFGQFLDWLKTEQSTKNIAVKTVGDVIGGVEKPKVTAPVVPSPTTDGSGIQNSSFETSANGAPACWQQAGFGTNTATYDTVSPGHTGTVAARLRMTAFTDGDAKVLQSQDLGSCSPAVTPGTAYALSAWYTSDVKPQFELYLRNAAGAWSYWDASPTFAAATAWTRATWVTKAVPAGYTGISFGLNIAAVGTVTVDDFAIANAAHVPVTTATATPATPDGTNGWYRTTPTVALSNDIVAAVTTSQFSFTGTTWSTYATPIAVPLGKSTLSYRTTATLTSEAGTTTLTEPTKTLALKVDTDKPKLTATYSSAARTIAVTATDATSGVSAIQQRVGTGGWLPYAGNGAAGDAARTVQYRAMDVAGNVSDSATIVVPARTVVSPPPAVTPATPTVTLSTPTTQSYGSKHSATVTVTRAGGVPTGSVTLLLDGKPVGQASLAAGTASIAIPTSVKVGAHSVTASYAGDPATASAASATSTLTVKKAAATVKAVPSKSKAVAHRTTVKVTVTSTIHASTLKPTGKITVLIDGKAVKSTSLTAGKHGRVVITIPRFATTGVHVLKARLSASAQVTTTTSSAHSIRVRAH